MTTQNTYRAWLVAFVAWTGIAFMAAIHFASPQYRATRLADTMNGSSPAMNAAREKAFSSDLKPTSFSGGEADVYCFIGECTVSRSDIFFLEDRGDYVSIAVEVSMVPELDQLQRSSFRFPTYRWKARHWNWSVRQLSKFSSQLERIASGSFNRIDSFPSIGGTPALGDYVSALAAHMQDQLQAQ